MRTAGYDIIGDVHGCAETLKQLLVKLEYQEHDGSFWHPYRKTIFVGDLIDRGPHIRETLQLVKHMVDRGHAYCVLGNHEYNAIYHHLQYPEFDYTGIEPGSPDTPRYLRQLAETLRQFEHYPAEWNGYLEWFMSLPIFLEFTDFRVVHACWDRALIDEFYHRYGRNTVNHSFLEESASRGTFAHRCVQRLTRGTDITLPEGRKIKGSDGHERPAFRTKFWADEPQTYQDVVFQPDPLPDDLKDRPLSHNEREGLVCYDADEKPLFVGHYWLKQKPEPIRDNIVCLDYSAVKDGRLVAYRYDGEATLNAAKFSWVFVDSELLGRVPLKSVSGGH